MINRNKTLFVSWPVLFLLSGCNPAYAAPPPPALPGPNPLIDRVLVSLQYFFPLLILIAVIVLIAAGIYIIAFKRIPIHRISKYTPTEIAQTRYASGEISREEYLEIIKDLKPKETEEKDIAEDTKN
ncbi:MAG: hypothetical protein DRP57_04900 [Spirochaetes bacterium]|nr:MAG: hypothetical protein DRP57_04900 [Spirochaetota bacterium]